MQDAEVARIRGLRDEARNALARDDPSRAELHFSRAIGLIEELADPKVRRREYGAMGVILVRSPFPHLALKAAKEALSLDQQLGDAGPLIADMLTYGTALGHLGQLREAADVFRQLEALCLEQGRYAEAASASTNLGATLVKLGEMEGARRLFLNSLEYLKRQGFPDTEIQTRLNLLSLYEHLNEDPKASLEFARETLDRFPEEMRGGYRAMADERVRTAASRYLQSHGGPAAEQWLRRCFPELDLSTLNVRRQRAARRGK